MMTLTELENLSAAELKDRRDECDEAIKVAKLDELQARYLRTLVDAKLRDERLGESAKTHAALSTSVESLKERAVVAERALEEVKDRAANEKLDLATRYDALTDELVATRTKLRDEGARAERLKAAATRHLRALRDIAAASNECLADLAIEQADRAEENTAA